MDKKTCVICSTENEKHFTYCRYCGALLPVVDKVAAEEEPLAVCEPVLENFIFAKGISRAEYGAYIGKNAKRILSFFEKSEKSGSRFYLNFPLLVLGMIFGFYGIAAWFFSRRVMKYGWLATLCGMLVTVLDFRFNLQVNRVVIETLASLGPDSYKVFSYYDPVSISGITGIIGTFFASVFSLSLYKDKADADILKIKEGCENKERLLPTLAVRGGLRISYIFIPILCWVNTALLCLAASML